MANKKISRRRSLKLMVIAAGSMLLAACQSQEAQEIAVVDEEECVGCEQCVDVCPVGAISMADEIAQVDAGQCVGCERCVEVCPVGAISMDVA